MFKIKSSIDRRRLLGCGGVTIAATLLPDSSRAALPVQTYDPFAPVKPNYAKFHKQLFDRKGARHIVDRLWREYVSTGIDDYAIWAMMYWYNYWRLVPLGKERISAAKVGKKMAAQMLSKRKKSAWATFWQASFVGLEAISIGVLNAAQLLPEFKDKMEEVIGLDPDLYYGNAYLGLAKLYIKAPAFPVSLGNPEKGYRMLDKAGQYQEGKFALWYQFLAEAEMNRSGKQAAYRILDRLEKEVQPPDIASQYILETARMDAASFRLAVEEGRYNKYKWDPLYEPLKTSG